MASSIVHRGPDDEGYYEHGPIAFAARRLAILDLSPAGHQPLSYGGGQYVVVFNGAIYNFRELRAELVALGHRFRSDGDTEVLVAAYAQWGADCVHRFNGMFAFLIHDVRASKVFGARDRFGQKPLYRHRATTALLFGSEIKSIIASGLVAPTPNWTQVAQLLAFERVERVLGEGATFLAGIEEVPAGSAFEVTLDGRERWWQYWTPDAHAPERALHPCDFRDLLEDAVRIHTRADVPVGISLSGGLDSTTIACLIARARTSAEALRAFSYVATEFGEEEAIRETAARTGAVLDAQDMDPLRAFELLPTVLRFHDEPVHSLNAVVGYDIYRRAARAGTKVVLGGQGADELLAGYTSGFPLRWASLLAAGDVGEARRQITAFVAAHGGSAQRLMLGAARELAFGLPSRSSSYRNTAARRLVARARASHAWCSPAVLDHLPGARFEPRSRTLSARLAYEQAVTPLPCYLRIEDRNAMAHSVESRLPYLDTRIADLAASLPDRQRLDGPWNKVLLREAMRGIIPESVRTHVVKLGFPVPSSRWMRGPLYEPMRDLITSQAARERGLYDVKRLAQLLDAHRAGHVDAADALFTVAQLELWFGMPLLAGRVQPGISVVTSKRQINTTRIAAGG